MLAFLKGDSESQFSASKIKLKIKANSNQEELEAAQYIKYLFLRAGLQANRGFLYPQRPTLTLMYFLVTFLSASPQETKALSGGHNTWQRSLAEGAACFAGIGTVSRQLEVSKLPNSNY